MISRNWIGLLAALAILAAAAETGRAAGMMVPEDESIPPLALRYLRVDTTIEDQVATTRISQAFQNSTSRDLECTYIFPLPESAAIRDFAMYINGKRMKGELLERERARQVFEEIVRRVRDPGLLEYIDGKLLRMRIFPVPANGTQQVELEYTELVPMDGGLAEYVFPLRTGEKASRTLEDFTVAVRIKSDVPIKSVYSPTHEVGVSRPTDHEAVAGTETRAALLNKDFHLFYTVSEKAFGLNLMTYRPDPKQPGMFLMLLSPKSEINADQRVPRDLAFVLDTSGSMKGEKIEQARKALKFCLDKLDRRDRFAIVQYSTGAEVFPGPGRWAEVDKKTLARAHEWIDGFEAAGGTNIGEALDRALELSADPDRPATVLFLTDGRPTVNITDVEALAKKVEENNRRNLRLFAFGVGDDVNTKLLDRMSGDTGGLTEYIGPSQPIDGKVTRLFSKMSHPVLTNLEIEVPGVKVTEMYPKELPDLFRGSQIVLVGSYTGQGDSVIRLKGKVGKQREELVYEGTFPARTVDRSFIAPLHAHRKIGYLLDQVRLHGENSELRDEVVRLSLAYGIETPYTSYLVLESEAQYKQYGIARNAARSPMSATDTYDLGLESRAGGRPTGGRGAGGPHMAPRPAPTAAPEDIAQRRSEALKQAYGNRSESGPATDDDVSGPARRTQGEPPPAYVPAPAEPGESGAKGDWNHGRGEGNGAFAHKNGPSRESSGLRAKEKDLREAETGKDAVRIATAISRMRKTERLDGKLAAQTVVQERGGKRMVRYRGVWVDEAFEGTEELVKVKWGSPGYFKLVRERPEMKEVLALGEWVVVVTARGKALVIDTKEGAEVLADEALKALFEPAVKRAPDASKEEVREGVEEKPKG